MGTPAWNDNEYSEFSGELGRLSDSWLRRITSGPLVEHPIESLDPTNIAHSAHGLFGLSTLVCDLATTAPHLMAIYDQDARQITLDWRLFCVAITGKPTAQVLSRALDISPGAKFVYGWCVASDMVSKSDYLKIGFVPHTTNFSRQELERISATWEMLANVLIPEPRLVKQAESYGIPPKVLMRADWRSEVSKYVDAEAFITLVAHRNNCLRLIAELQLDRYQSLPMLAHVFNRLYLELPIFQVFALKAAKAYAKEQPLTQELVQVRFSL